MRKIVSSPEHTLIEKTALELAMTWYEVGRSQGLTSKWSNPKSYARANFTKFIPKAVEILVSMLGRSDIHELQKSEIYESLMERHNDPTLNSVMPNIPNIDISKILPKHDRVNDIITTAVQNTANPFKLKGH